MAIFSVALSISLRAWERQQNRQPSDVPSLLGLLKYQLATFEPLQVNAEGKKRVIFEGDGHALAFATAYSVRAISKGLPVIARYVFNPGRGELYYAELPLDPYHSESLGKFLQMTPGTSKSSPHFYVTEVAEFSLSYVGKERETLDAAMDGTSGLPAAVMVNCTAKGSPETLPLSCFSILLLPNCVKRPSGRRAICRVPSFPGKERRADPKTHAKGLEGDGKRSQ